MARIVVSGKLEHPQQASFQIEKFQQKPEDDHPTVNEIRIG
jgi:hypothetical protein